jgi:hypothetical protein
VDDVGAAREPRQPRHGARPLPAAAGAELDQLDRPVAELGAGHLAVAHAAEGDLVAVGGEPADQGRELRLRAAVGAELVDHHQQLRPVPMHAATIDRAGA